MFRHISPNKHLVQFGFCRAQKAGIFKIQKAQKEIFQAVTSCSGSFSAVMGECRSDRAGRSGVGAADLSTIGGMIKSYRIQSSQIQRFVFGYIRIVSDNTAQTCSILHSMALFPRSVPFLVKSTMGISKRRKSHARYLKIDSAFSIRFCCSGYAVQICPYFIQIDV